MLLVEEFVLEIANIGFADLVFDHVLLKQGNIYDIDIVEHRLAIKSTKDDDFVGAIGVCTVPLSTIHEVETLGACVVNRQIPVLFLKVEADELVASHLTVVTSENVQAISKTVSAVPSESIRELVFVLDLSPGVRNGVESVEVIQVSHSVVPTK